MSIFGIPKVIQSDRGLNFFSKMFLQLLQQLRLQQSRSSAYHAESQGVLEHFHQTFKALLCSYCVQLGGDREDRLSWLLLAAREVVQESTGFSPNKNSETLSSLESVFGYLSMSVLLNSLLSSKNICVCLVIFLHAQHSWNMILTLGRLSLSSNISMECQNRNVK